MKKNKIIRLFSSVLCIVCMFSGCSEQLTDLEVENIWTNILNENNIDYKSFSEPAKQAVYGLRSDEIEGFISSSGDDVEMLKKLFSYTDVSQMESDAIVSATVEDMFIISGITEAYANSESIDYAVKTYCDRCYDNQKVVKSGTYTIKLSSKESSGNVEYNGKISDLKKFLNNFIHSEARNGYCVIEINDYNSPVSVKWSKNKIKNDEELYATYYDIEEIEMGKAIVGVYPGTFYVNNTITSRTIDKTSLSTELGGYQSESISADDIEDMQEWFVETFTDDIDNAIRVFELEGDKNKSENNEDNNTPVKNYTEAELESMMNTANSNAKLVYTNAATYVTKTVVNGYSIEDGWYVADLDNNGDYGIDCNYDGKDIEKGLTSLMGTDNDNAGYACVYISNESPKCAFYCRENIFPYMDFDTLPETLYCDSHEIVGAYPHSSIMSENANYTINSIIVNDFSTDENMDSEKEKNNISPDTAVNPFDGLKIEFDGASPYLKASVNTSECNDDTKAHIRFSVSEEPLKLGDYVTVTAEWNSDCGVEFSQSSMEYAVENAAYYLNSLDGVDLSELNQLMDDYVEAEANKYVDDSVIFGIASHHEPWYNGEAFTIGYNPIVTGIGKINVSNNYFLSLKQSSSLYRDEVYNKYMGIYEVEYSTYRKATDEYSNNTAILAVFIDNIVMDTDGTLKYNSTENLNSKMFYREVEDTIAIIESNYVVSEKAQYNVTECSSNAHYTESVKEDDTLAYNVSHVTVKESSANIRSTPDKTIETNKIAGVNKGEHFRVISYDGYW